MSCKHMPEIITIAAADAERPRHSEGTIVEKKDGTLLVVWQEYLRSSLGSADEAPNRLSSMVSSDGGKTWHSPRVLVETPTDAVNVYSPSFLRDQSGCLMMGYFCYHTLEACKTPVSSGYLIRSNNDGETFCKPASVWTNQPFSSAASVLRRLRNGRIIWPIGQITGGLWTETERELEGCMYSDDDGVTWHLSRNWIDLPMRGSMEAHIEELSDGRLMMIVRTQLGSLFQSFSENGGETWSKAQTTSLRSPESCPALVQLPHNDDLLVIWNNAPYDPQFRSHYGKRSPLTVAISQDKGDRLP